MVRLCALALLVLLTLGGAPALGATASFTGILTIVGGGGSSGLPISESVTGGGIGSYDTGTFSFTLPTAAFVTNRSTPIGFTPNAPANSIYTIRSISNQSSGPGSFGAGAAPGGGFGGIMNTGLDITLLIGLVPLPNVFGSLLIPVSVGVSAPPTTTATAAITGNMVTVSVVRQGWTTGPISVNDQTPSAPTGTTATTFTAVGTNNLGASGGQITLVTPFVVRLIGGVAENRAGYATLSLNVSVPEPGAALLLGLGTAALLVAGRRSRRA